MSAEAVVYFTTCLISETVWVRKLGYSLEKIVLQLSAQSVPLDGVDNSRSTMDADVLSEVNRLVTANPAEYTVLLRDFEKTYLPSLLGMQPKCAVRGISLGCQSGERLGLLGPNGAGKTSVFSILTGDTNLTSGFAYIGGLDVQSEETRSLIGYCPQQDPLLDLMTARETLWFFGRIRGIDPAKLSGRIERLIVQIGLTLYADVTCGTYSGGNKRKLSLACSLIGDPILLFLDEPSSGNNVVEHVE